MNALKQTVFDILTFIAVALFLSVPVVMIGPLLHWFYPALNVSALTDILFVAVAQLALLLVLVWRLPRSERKIIYQFPHRWLPEISFGIAVGLLLVLLQLVLLSLITGTFFLPTPLPSTFQSSSPLPAVVLALLVAPLIEEGYFRGAVLRRFQQSNQLILGSGLSALLFGLSHPGAPGTILLFFLTGLVLAWLWQRRQTIWAGIIAHLVLNGIVLFSLFGR